MVDGNLFTACNCLKKKKYMNMHYMQNSVFNDKLYGGYLETGSMNGQPDDRNGFWVISTRRLKILAWKIF